MDLSRIEAAAVADGWSPVEVRELRFPELGDLPAVAVTFADGQEADRFSLWCLSRLEMWAVMCGQSRTRDGSLVYAVLVYDPDTV